MTEPMITRSEMKELAEEAATRVLERFIFMLGTDTKDADSVREFGRDLDWVRKHRDDNEYEEVIAWARQQRKAQIELKDFIKSSKWAVLGAGILGAAVFFWSSITDAFWFLVTKGGH